MGHHLVIIQFVVLCWTAGVFRAQQLDNKDEKIDEPALSYFFYQRPLYPRDCQEVLQQCSSNNISGVHLIKPDGYPEPFEVYCDSVDFQAWTVIQRRGDGSLDFNRIWDSYQLGFGFLSHEFWIGNEKLAYLTNQKIYELRIDVTSSSGSSFYVSYNLFRISDGFSSYKLISLGQYSGTAGDYITWCPHNMKYGNCSCQRTCEGPNNCLDTCADTNHCTCPEGYYINGTACILQEECGCYISGVGIILEGDFHVSPGCTRRAVCSNGQLTWDDTYSCGSDATCGERDNVRQCYCNVGYTGDGQSCSAPTGCLDIYNAGDTDSGVYFIKPSNWPGSPFEVYCDMSDGGGWTVFQRRIDGVTDFYRNWRSYRNGFGSFNGDFWLGNERLHYLTNQATYSLRVDIVTSSNVRKYDEYSSFRVGDESTKYQVADIGSHSGNAGNGMQYSSGRSFSTHDRDNDGCGNHNCAARHRGAWWYTTALVHSHCTYCIRDSYCDQFQYDNNCDTVCSKANLNGDYSGGRGENIYWNFSNNCNVRRSVMKIRPSL